MYKWKRILEKKVIQRSVRLNWSVEKVKCEANHGKNWAKSTKYVPLASCIL